MKKHPYILIASGAALWGIIGVFVKGLQGAGLNSMEITTLRAISASAILFPYMAVTARQLLRVRIKDLRFFMATGILSVAFFNWCYFTAIKEISISIAVILLYTAPAFVIIISRALFNEKITAVKMAVLILTGAGCCLTTGFIPGAALSVSLKGLFAGLGSGLGYALYSIFAKPAGRIYSPVTITAYTFLFTAMFLLPFTGIQIISESIGNGSVIFYSAGLGLFPTALAYIFYTKGLAQVETGNASLIANIEPVVAILTGVILFGERITLSQAGGAILIIVSLLIMTGFTIPHKRK